LIINNVIEINNKDQEETIINQIEYIIKYLNNRDDEIDDNSDNIKELEEKYKEDIDNLKTFSHGINLLDKCFTQ
jgi:ABC-type transporter Mla subunit MlaD